MLKIKDIGKIYLVKFCIFSLVNYPTIVIPAEGVQSNNWVNMANGISNMIGSFGKMQVNTLNQTMNSRKMSGMMTRLKPKIIPAKYFPHCKMSQAASSFPVNACKNVGSPQELAMANQFVALAYNYERFYEQLQSEAQNTTHPVGIQCLKDAQTKFNQQIKDKLNYLSNLRTQLNKTAQFFKEESKKNLDRMSDLNDELNGGGEENLESNARNISKYFKDSACNEVISANVLEGNQGLRNIQTTMTSADSGKDGKSLINMSSNLKHDQYTIVKHLDKQVERIKDDINARGIDDWIETFNPDSYSRGGLTNFEGLKAISAQKAAEIKTIYKRASGFLKSVNYKLPPLDQNFGENIKDFAKDAKTFLRKQRINQCATLKDGQGLGLSPEKVLSGLRQNGANSYTAKRYRKALEMILRQDRFIEDKLDEIRRLDNKAAESIKVSIDTVEFGNQSVTPYELYRRIVDKCAADYDDNKLFSPGDPNGTSFKRKVEKATNYINEVKTLGENFATEIAKEIKEAVLNCGSAADIKSGTCNAEKLDTSSKSFCLSSSLVCANLIGQCHNKTKNLIASKERKIKANASVYNIKVKALIVSQEEYLKKLTAQVNADAEWFKKYFPGSQYNLPEDLFIKMPELTMTRFGVKLAGGEDIDSFLQYLPDQIKKLEGLLTGQNQETNIILDKYIAEQQGAISKNMSKWSSLATSCSSAADSYRKQYGEQTAKQMAAQSKTMGEITKFCYRYEGLKEAGPGPGCDDEDNSASELYNDAVKIASLLHPEVGANLHAYRKLCGQWGADDSDGEDDDDDYDRLVRLCDSANNDWEEVEENILDKILKHFPKKKKTKLKQVRKFLKGDLKIGKITKDDSIANALENFKELVEMNKESKERGILINADLDIESGELLTSATSTTMTTADIKKNLQNIKRILSVKKMDHDNICDLMDKELARNALYACLDDGGRYSKCFDDEFDKKRGKLGSLKNAGAANRYIRVISRSLNKSNTLDDEWSEIGENAEGVCHAFGGASRKKDSNKNIFGELDTTLDKLLKDVGEK